MKRFVLASIAWLALALGAVGALVPVLPTTPLLLLSSFLFAKSSPRLHAWISSTRLYRGYVVPFKQQGGLTRRRKVRILAVSYAVLAVSAIAVREPAAWVVLALVAAALAVGILARIPTVSATEQQADGFTL